MTASKHFQHAVKIGERPLLTLAALDVAIDQYRDTHKGRNPNAKSGPADDGFGYAIMWSTINMRFVHAQQGLAAHGLAADLTRQYGDDKSKWPKSLGDYCAANYPQQSPLHGRPRTPALTLDNLIKAIRAYRTAHQGRNPNAFSGDAAPYFGYATNWNTVNNTISQTLTRTARGLAAEMNELFGEDKTRWPTTLSQFCMMMPQRPAPPASTP